MDLRHCGWYAPIEYTMNGGNRNARIVEDIVTTTSIGVGYCHWCVPLLLHLLNSGTVRYVEHSVPAFADSALYRAHANGSLRFDWSISHITTWTSKDSQLVDRQNGRFKGSSDCNVTIQGGSYTLPPIFVFQGENHGNHTTDSDAPKQGEICCPMSG